MLKFCFAFGWRLTRFFRHQSWFSPWIRTPQGYLKTSQETKQVVLEAMLACVYSIQISSCSESCAIPTFFSYHADRNLQARDLKAHMGWKTAYLRVLLSPLPLNVPRSMPLPFCGHANHITTCATWIRTGQILEVQFSSIICWGNIFILVIGWTK